MIVLGFGRCGCDLTKFVSATPTGAVGGAVGGTVGGAST